MTRFENSLSLLTVVADALGEYRSEMVFVGGTVTGLLITSPPLQQGVRPTDDVDVVVEASSYAKYNQLLDNLRKLGFVHDMDGPVCRFTVCGVTVDVMPTEESVLGFRNRWYPLAMTTAIPYTLPNELQIRLVNAPVFICTKLEAFRDRGKSDFYLSSDIEDIVAVVNGRAELIGEAWCLPVDARVYLRDSFENLSRDDDFLSALPGLLPAGSANRESIVRFRIEQFARIPLVESFSGQVMVNYATSPLSAFVVSMEGTTQTLASRDFESSDEFLTCLRALGINADAKRIRPDSFNELCTLSEVPLQVLADWGLLRPLD